MIKECLSKLKFFDRILGGCFVFLLFLIFLFGFLKLNDYLFFLLSLEANLFLIFIFRYILKKTNIKFNKIQKCMIFIGIFIFYLFYFFSIFKRKFIYYWDYSTYYNLQIFTDSAFNEGLMVGIRKFISSTWSGEYGNFISFFPELIFGFTSRTINAYVISCVVVFIPYIVLSLMIFLKLMAKKLESKKENIFIWISFTCFMFVPVLHSTFIYGQPDLFGLVFVFLIISLTLDYDFLKIDIDRFIVLIILTFMLLICRRWYIYWIFSYYVCYFLKLIIINRSDIRKLKLVIKNWFIFVIGAGVFFLITLLPMIKNIIFSDFGVSYKFYSAGGFGMELLNQIKHLGYIIFIFMLIGVGYGLIKSKYRLVTILNVIGYILMLFLFTRVQNMGLHHSLILLPVYLYFICLLVQLILLNDKLKSAIFGIVFVGCFLLNFLFGYYLVNDKMFFTDVPLRVENDKDYLQIEAVASWLKHNLSKENSAYMITHNNMYNPDKFRNFYMPDTTISSNIPYGSSILGVHKFPIELFKSRYVITSTPFVNTSVEEKYDFVLRKLVEMNKFELKKDFDMKNGYHILIYERIESFDREEAEIYLNVLKKESEMYPDLYQNVINEYIESY